MNYLYVLQQLRESCPTFINSIFVVLSEYLVAMFIAIPAVIYWCADKQAGKWMLLNYGGCSFVNQTIKNTFCVYRPWIRDSRLFVAKAAAKGATGYSFPSGHTTLTTSVFESLAVWQKKRKWVVILSAIVILFVATARNWLGCHTPADVITAILVSSLVIILNIFVVRFAQNNPDKKWILAVIGLVICAAMILYCQFKKYPIDFDSEGNILAEPYNMLTDCYTNVGLLSGYIIGWFIEQKWVDFSDEGTKKQKIFRGVIGTIILGLLYAVILPAVLDVFGDAEHLKHFLKYFLIMIYIVLLYPLAIKLIDKKIAKKANL